MIDSNEGNGNEGGGQATATRATRMTDMATAMATATMRVMAKVTRLAGNKEQGQQGQWQWQ